MEFLGLCPFFFGCWWGWYFTLEKGGESPFKIVYLALKELMLNKLTNKALAALFGTM
jgi:hypothetical protein